MTTASGAVASLLVLVTVLVTLTKLSRNNINKRAPSLGLPILEESAQRNREGEAVLSTSCPGRKPRKWVTGRSQSKRAPMDIPNSSPQSSNQWFMNSLAVELLIMVESSESNCPTDIQGVCFINPLSRNFFFFNIIIY